MKTFLIVLLSAALLASACFTRPDEEHFLGHLTRARATREAGASRKAAAEAEAEAFLEGCTFEDRILWVDVQRDGRTLYTGAFAHWFKHGTSGDAGDDGDAAAAKSKPKPAAKAKPWEKVSDKAASARNSARTRRAAAE